jgi:hypothetical protein
MTTIAGNTMTRCRFRPYGPDGDRLWKPEIRTEWARQAAMFDRSILPRAVFTDMPDHLERHVFHRGEE